MLNTTKEHNAVNNLDGVMKLVFCMPSNDLLYSYQVSQNYLKGF